MNPETIMESRFRRPALLFIFFLSGMSALIYQIIWVRMFGLGFGISVYAVSTVLTTFMAGLALGSLLFGRLADKTSRPIRLLLILELIIAVYGVLFLFLYKGLFAIYPHIYALLPFGLNGQSLIRFVLSFMLLIIPTLCMGGTLPIISRCYVRDTACLGGDMGRLYGANNLGAFTGCFLAGFFLIQWLGDMSTLLTGVFINIIIILLLLFLIHQSGSEMSSDVQEKSNSPISPEKNQTVLSGRLQKLILWAFAIEGFTTLAYEVIYTRMFLSYSHDRSIYFYTTIILAFIFGLSAGSFLIMRWADKCRDLLAGFAWIQTGIGLIVIALLPAMARAGEWLQQMRLHYTENWLFSMGREYGLFFLFCVLPAILMGFSFPIVSKIVTRQIRHLGRNIGLIGCLDIVGSILGSFAAGFILLPRIGVQGSLLLNAGLNFGIGLMIFMVHPLWSMKKRMAVMLTAFVPMIVFALFIPDKSAFIHYLTRQEGDRLLYHREGIGATVTVPQHVDHIKELTINGATAAWSQEDEIRVHLMMSYIPYVLHPAPEKALVIGMGMGVTAHALMHPEIKRVDCVEIDPEVFEAARTAFSDENHDLFNHSKFNPIIEDGRSLLLVTGDKYDIINSNAVHPRHSMNIYTREFYQLCQARLSEQGLMLQWLPTNWYSENEFKTLIRSCLDVFPETSLWIVSTSQVLLLSSKSPLKIPFVQLRDRLSSDDVKKDLKPYGLDDPDLFLAQYGCSAALVRAYVGDVPSATDDKTRIEFSRVVSKARNSDILKSLINLKTETLNQPLWIPEVVIPESGRPSVRNAFLAEIDYMKANMIRSEKAAPDSLESLLRSAVLRMPGNPRYHEALGIAAFRLGDYRTAMQAVLQLIALRPDYAESYERLGYILIQTGDPVNAAQAFKKALMIEPDRAMARYYLAALYAGARQFEPAITELDKVISDYPEYPPLYHLKGQILLDMGQIGPARDAFKHYLKLNPENPDPTIQKQLDILQSS